MFYKFSRNQRVIHTLLGTPGTVVSLSSTRERLNCYTVRWDTGITERGVLETALRGGAKLPPSVEKRGRVDRKRLEELRAEDWTLNIERTGKYKHLKR